MFDKLGKLLRDNPLTGVVTAIADAATAKDKPGKGSAHDFAFEGLRGGDLPLKQFAGRPLLVVNTASKCGFTPQYKGLEALYQAYGGRGLAIVGVPSNDFANQEPGSAEDIAEFCEINFGVTFPLAAKVPVTGDDAHPFFKWIAAERPLARPRWNFHKYLFDGQGKLVEAAASVTSPQSGALVKAIEKLLPETK
ncbi:glutathione peroxidase [Zavarzinia compransoris]|uniref:Glutathione peroxidase n=1 Tax=Zavarzinia compransoris TaxID=1264899 RepID=A0A317E2G3_9PROT|nr:glutathione peroxidase [Zavarzinia compransoris]PWR19563.1 glutathione peroxidase [Zavarzinia compransoris]TDP40456.1 glutathione peroxidase [Zavarzinia compransoris]